MNIQEYKELYPHCNPYKKTKEEAIKYIKDKYKLSPREAEKQYRAFKKMWVLTPSEEDKEKHKDPKDSKETKCFKYVTFEEYARHSHNYNRTMKVIELSKKDYSYKEISKATGISTSQVQRIRQAAFYYGVLDRKYQKAFKDRDFDKEKFIDMYNNHYSHLEMAKEFGTSETTMYITIQSLIESGEIKKRKRVRRCGSKNKNKK